MEAMMSVQAKAGHLGHLPGKDGAGQAGALRPPCSQPEATWPGKLHCPPSFPVPQQSC